jgi:UDP-N-acetylglucosamine 2-epimerase (non-hydrolysing)
MHQNASALGHGTVHLMHVVGARPNFPKLAPVYRAARALGLRQMVVHTGQHYDEAMSAGFFRTLDIPEPDVNLKVGSASHAVQTARIMERLEPVLLEHRPAWMVVYGDINSTAAAALVASKIGVRVAHVEAGLRSGDWSMPEEVNRVVTDRLANLLLTPSRDADETLRREGEPDEEIAFAGNVMIDSLFHALPEAQASGFAASQGIGDGEAVIVTLHRPSNVDDPARMASLVSALREIASERPVLFPAHPRTAARLREAGLDLGAVRLIDPVDYIQMLDLMSRAHVVVTDSGGLQEETTALGVPCLTVRDNTERPITITEGTNRLVRDPAELPALVRAARRDPDSPRPEGWDGHAGERIAGILAARIPGFRSGKAATAQTGSATLTHSM